MHSLRHLLALLVAVGVVLLSHPPVRADITVGEAAAGISGSSLMELNPDSSGYLYAGDFTAPAILTVNAAGGQYSRYVFSTGAGFLIQPGDPKPGPTGELWWSDYATAFGKLTTGSLQAEYWNLASRGLNPGGFAFDASGRIWFTQPNNAQLIRFTPSERSLCTFSVGGGGNYITSQGNLLWLTDQQTGRLLRFDASNNQLRAWTLPGGWQTPEGLALDGDGRVWWADSGAGLIGRLTPGSNQVVVVTLPAGSQPVMLAVGTEVMWYTDGGGFAGLRRSGAGGRLGVDRDPNDLDGRAGQLSYARRGHAASRCQARDGDIQFPCDHVGHGRRTARGNALCAAKSRVHAGTALGFGIQPGPHVGGRPEPQRAGAHAAAAAKPDRIHQLGGGREPADMGGGDKG